MTGFPVEFAREVPPGLTDIEVGDILMEVWSGRDSEVFHSLECNASTVASEVAVEFARYRHFRGLEGFGDHRGFHRLGPPQLDFISDFVVVIEGQDFSEHGWAEEVEVSFDFLRNLVHSEEVGAL